jgi:hypothetical protein
LISNKTNSFALLRLAHELEKKKKIWYLGSFKIIDSLAVKSSKQTEHFLDSASHRYPEDFMQE